MSDKSDSGSKGADSAPNIQPGKGTNPAQCAPLPDWQAPATRGGWFGGGK